VVWFIRVGDSADSEVDLGDVDPKLFLPIARNNDVYWYEFYENPARVPDLAVELARAVALEHGQPFDVSGYDFDTMRGLVAAFNDMYRWVAGDDLPKTGTTEGFPSTDDQTTETSSSSGEPADGPPIEPAA
jgi:hypothetical protein